MITCYIDTGSTPARTTEQALDVLQPDPNLLVSGPAL
ncbi:hypothetical protein JOF36_002174 [Pseudonocardia parietis]|uniref:Uncharacterized protein n=1 Tax=Pseudonocardia parietis TaxID=570936 RepID=A0ABS4VRC1_9PSEU|nr:hypothetical protein [Pseudonocardia parietis]